MSNPPTPSSRSAGGRAVRKPARPRRRRFVTMKGVKLSLLGLFLLGVAGLIAAFATTDIPPPNELANAQASIVYYSDGKTVMDRISEVDGNRESLPLTKIPLHVQRALLAAEDRSFYQNKGISPTGIGRSVMVAVRGGATQGGSTITQQYVKNYFLTQDKTISRKAKEFIISIKIDQQESKDTILANYLNTIYYGRGAQGIQTAAKAYFGHDASKLTVAEGALLASVIRGPSFYDPSLGPKQKANATARVDYVLDGMVSQGWLSKQERAQATFPTTIARTRVTKAGTIPYITDEVRKELKVRLKLSDNDIDRAGLRIVTTIDRKAQDSAVKAMAENMPSEKAAPLLHAGLTAIRPRDGAIVAMYGGKDYSKIQTNSSTDATMQGGSTFKAFGLLAALQKGISTKTRYAGYSPQFFPEFKGGDNPRGRVDNFGHHSYPTMDLRRATAKSVNTIFDQLNIDLADGSGKATGVKDAAILAGLPKTTRGLGTNMNNILGTASVRVIDMANAYATIAAQGQRATPYLIAKVTSADGSIDYKVKQQLSPAFDKDVTADATEAMTRVVTEGTASGARRLGRPAAGKTGTTDNNLAVWFDGFTPQLSAAVGMYQNKGLSTDSIKVAGINEVTGGTLPVKIWTAFMKGALKGEKVMYFPARAGVGDAKVPRERVVPRTTTTATATPSPTTTGPPATTTASPATKAPPRAVRPTRVPPTKVPPPAPIPAPVPTAPPPSAAAVGLAGNP